ncbi:MAG: hypothetical protein ABIR37_04890 [Candidatus Saccharimonadales bacterium]
MAIHEIISHDLSISTEDFQSLDYEGKVEHRMRVALGLRKGVGGFAVQASKEELTAFQEKEHIGPNGKSYEVHPYDMLHETIVRRLASEGIHAPAEQETELPAAA